MKPKAFTKSIQDGKTESGYLFLGNEAFFRDRCRQALKKAVIGDDAEAFVEIDLKKESLTRLWDETRSLSLFSTARLIVGFNAEAVLPRARSAAADEAKEEMKRYFADPTPGVVVVFECTKFNVRERDDKAKADRVAKFFDAVPVAVELDRLGASDTLRAVQALAERRGLKPESDVLAELADMLGGDLARLDSELEKLSLYAGESGVITRADVELLTPEARQGGVFELSDALAHKDRSRALEIVDTLAAGGAYWPMQLTLLAGLFRQALAVRELNARDSRQVVSALGRLGVRIWPSRAQQLLAVAGKFSKQELEKALTCFFEADRDLRRERPDDRFIMERLIIELTA
ncbi:MAG: DNA polymerase III subunit delta [Acidobacteria bacterium]|nr:DNA polymerase III subunit delta [Acidobacteriota bacterium]MDA1234142.1 DNA polymerase III subunit delta [Acidobacteriota bacterium]